jgi:hypothetical protein
MHRPEAKPLFHARRSMKKAAKKAARKAAKKR